MVAAVRAGELRHLVAIEAHNGLETRSGAPDQRGWHEYCQAWVAIEGQAGSKSEAPGGLEVETATATIRGRYLDLAGTTPAMRVRWVDGNRVRLFAIDSVVNVGELRDEMRLSVREVSPAADDPAVGTLPAAVGAE